MAIHVICPGCHTRFSVGDQHAGKTGACPKCKGQITIPAKGDEVVIHAPESEAGAKDAKGRSVLKPLRRKETKFRLNAALVIGAAVLLTVGIAFVIRFNKGDLENAMTAILVGGAMLLGPPLAYAGYFFLRDDEMEPFRGSELLVRSLGCGLAYAAAWGVYWYVGYQIFTADAYLTEGLEVFQIGILVAIAVGLGTGAAFVAFDFEPITGFFHFALYFVATVLLRAAMGISMLPGMA